MDYFEDDADTASDAPVDVRGTFVLAVSTTLLAAAFLFLLIGDQAAAAALFPF